MTKNIEPKVQNSPSRNQSKLFLLLSCALIAMFAATANAATYTVTTTADSGAGSLRDIISMVNNTTEADTINFNFASGDANCSGGVCTITLTTGDLEIADTSNGGGLTINGTGASSLKISGNNNSRIFYILSTNSSVPVTINNLTATNGKSLTVLGGPDSTAGLSGGILNEGLLILNSVVVTNSTATESNYSTGGIYSTGYLTLNSCSVINNTGGYTSQTSGNFNNTIGGITAAHLTLNNSSVSNNVGGGLNVSDLTMNNSLISGNQVNNSTSGGGIICGGGSANINNSTISGNTTRTSSGVGATISGCYLTMNNSTISNNTGYAINTVLRNVYIYNSTISGNTGRDTGAIFAGSGTLSLTNVTITNNRANAKPISTLNGGGTGGIKLTSGSNSLLFVRNSIIAGNSSAVPNLTNTPDIYLVKSTSGDNTDPADPQSYGIFTSQGNNLIGDAMHISEPANTGASIHTQSSDILNQPANLTPLGNYGGATQTHALLSDSLAINAGNNCVLAINGCGMNDPIIALNSDQRGAARFGNVDIGAFELNDVNNGGNYRASLPATSTSQSYNVVVAQYDDTQYPNLTFSVTNGTLPNGVSLTTTSSFAQSVSGEKLSGDDTPNKTEAVAAVKTVSLTGTPTQTGTFNFTITSSDGTNINNTGYSLAVVGPTAASVTIVGRAIKTDGRGIANILITLTDANGNVRTTLTSPFGYYRFADVAAGGTYILTAVGKRFTFAQPTQILSVTADVEDVNFIADANYKNASLFGN